MLSNDMKQMSETPIFKNYAYLTENDLEEFCGRTGTVTLCVEATSSKVKSKGQLTQIPASVESKAQVFQ